jgi:hypothetical protein
VKNWPKMADESLVLFANYTLDTAQGCLLHGGELTIGNIALNRPGELVAQRSGPEARCLGDSTTATTVLATFA